MKYIEEEDKKKYVGYTLRISITNLNKLHYIADYNERPVSYELRPLIARFIAEFEKKHGEIIITPNYNKKLESRRQKRLADESQD